MHLKIEKIWPRFPAFSLRSFLPRRLLVGKKTIPPVRIRFVAFLWLACRLWPSAWAQDLPSFKTATELVLVDLVATDRDGNFIWDLRPEELEVLEDGKRQTVTFFNLQNRGAPVPARAPEKPGQPAPSASSVPIQTVEEGYYVFLMDLHSMPFDALGRSKEAVRGFVESRLGPDDQVMLATIRHRLRINQPFTQDIDKFSQALDRVPFEPRLVGNLSRFMEVMDDIFADMGALGVANDPSLAQGNAEELAPQIEGAIQMAAGESRQILSQMEIQVAFSCAATGALARHLRSLPGRKHLMLISAGYPLNARTVIKNIIRERAAMFAPNQYPQVHMLVNSSMAGSGRRTSFESRMRSVIDQANRSQVSIYSIDPRGLMPPAISYAGTRQSGSHLYASHSNQDITAPQDFLTTLSAGTGGLSFLNDNDLARGIGKAFDDGRSYYLLGYAPRTKRKPGKFHEIRVKLARKGVKLRYRRGYVDTDPEQTAHADLANAFKFPELFRDFPFRVQVSNQTGKLKVRTLIPTRSFAFSRNGGKNRCVMEMFGALVDDSGKWVGEDFLFFKRLDLDLDSEGLNLFQRYRNFSSSSEKDAPPGKYDLVVVLRQSLSGRMATSTSSVVVH